METPKTVNYSWPLYLQKIEDVILQIKQKNFQPDVIVGISRGGLIPAQLIAYKLGVKHVITYGVYSYKEKEYSGSHVEYQLPSVDSLLGKKVLFVDDLADRGETLLQAIQKLSKHAALYKTATVLMKDKSIITPDFVTDTIDSSFWVKFPYDL